MPRWGAVIFVRVNQVLVRLWTPQAVESLTGKCALVLYGIEVWLPDRGGFRGVCVAEFEADHVAGWFALGPGNGPGVDGSCAWWVRPGPQGLGLFSSAIRAFGGCLGTRRR